MDGTPYRPCGLVVISVWLEPSAGRSPAESVRARIISTRDVIEGIDETRTAAGTGAVVAAVECLLTDWASAN
jgi:hypothetical protein